MRRRGIRRKQLLDDLKETREYWNLKWEALDRLMPWIHFGRGWVLFARQSTGWLIITEVFIVPRDDLFYSMLLSVRVLYYQPHCHKCLCSATIFVLSGVQDFVSALKTWQQLGKQYKERNHIKLRNNPPRKLLSLRILLTSPPTSCNVYEQYSQAT
jgi:hypothetical protein